jgi:hypothetical protein
MRVQLQAPDRELRAALARLADGPAAIRKVFTTGVKEATAPLETALKRAVMAVESRTDARGTGPGLPEHTGLRANTARGIQRKVEYRGTRTGVRIRVDKKHLREDQREMPEAMDSGKVRHPVMGNRNVWVNQTFTPSGWYTDTLRVHGPIALEKIIKAANEAVQNLQ